MLLSRLLGNEKKPTRFDSDYSKRKRDGSRSSRKNPLLLQSARGPRARTRSG
jgi:hypothetical protein